MKNVEPGYEIRVGGGHDPENDHRNPDGANQGPIETFMRKVQGLWRTICDPDSPKASKRMAVGTLVYLVSPIDWIPAPIRLAGVFDDAVALTAALAALSARLKRCLKRNS